MKLDEDGWPDELLIPDVDEFNHGMWMALGDEANRELYSQGAEKARYAHDNRTEQMAKALKIPEDYHCGTQCCLVGWAGVAFRGPFSADAINTELSKAHRTFLETFLEIAGVPPLSGISDYTLLIRLSNLFEHRLGLSGEGPIRPLSAKQARAWWIETAKRCGYDVSAFEGAS